MNYVVGKLVKLKRRNSSLPLCVRAGSDEDDDDDQDGGDGALGRDSSTSPILPPQEEEEEKGKNEKTKKPGGGGGGRAKVSLDVVNRRIQSGHGEHAAAAASFTRLLPLRLVRSTIWLAL